MNIKQLMKDNNLTIYKLSQISGVPYTTVREYVSGKTKILNMNVRTAKDIASVLRVKIDDLISMETEPAEFDYDSIGVDSSKEFFKYYLDNRKNVILRSDSAAEYMGLSNLTLTRYVKVYSITDLPKPFDVIRVPNFNDIEYEIKDGILITSLSQTINDMIEDKEMDRQPLYEALNHYYYKNNESYDGLNIKKKNIKAFNRFKKYAEEYYEY